MVTPDIEQIRAALAGFPGDRTSAWDNVTTNAPVWLASCCDEIERLRALDHEDTRLLVEALTERDSARAERDAALALVQRKNGEIDDLRKMGERRLQLMARNWRERNAALAECERLRTLVTTYSSQLANFAATVEHRNSELAAARDEIERIKKINALNARQCLAWRACADQFAAVGIDLKRWKAALAVYEQLKAGS